MSVTVRVAEQSDVALDEMIEAVGIELEAVSQRALADIILVSSGNR